ncbi:MAG: methyltransferase domain-containing protein [Acidobacteriota bacterium]
MRNSQTLLAFRQNLHLLHCPVCKGQMFLYENQLKCINGHSFDLSGEGYINLVRHTVKTNYSRQLFRSRKNITQKGFFKPITDLLGLEIAKRKNNCKSLTLLDAGCGEGTLFHQLKEQLSENNIETNAIGLDISKEGIRIASRDYKDVLWMVANLADLPITDNSTDIIINLLAPANYSQFQRVLAPGGILIKAVPGKEYLKELRTLFSVGKRAPENPVPQALSLFENYRSCVESYHIMKTVKIEEENVQDLAEMTPLLWNLKNKQEKMHEIKEVTLDMHLLFGYKNGK